MNLHILDLKQYMYTGVSKPALCTRGVVEDQHQYRAREFRCGSLAYFIDEVTKILKDSKNVVAICCDTTPTYKRELSETMLHVKYKDGRAKAPEHVTYQYDFAKRMVNALNLNVILLDGYEADDGVSSIIYKYGKQYDRIVVHTNDSDQYYLVDEKTSIMPTSLKGKQVNLSNYPGTVKRGEVVPYNSITMNKLVNAESSDNIPAMSHEYAKRLYRTIPDICYPFCGNNELLRTCVKNITKNDARSMAICDMIMPVVITDERVTVDPTKRVNGNLLHYFGVEFGSYEFSRHNPIKDDVGEQMIEDFLDELVDKEVI